MMMDAVKVAVFFQCLFIAEQDGMVTDKLICSDSSEEVFPV